MTTENGEEIPYWNYRVLCETFAEGKLFSLHEVYYSTEGEPTSWSADPVDVTGETWIECVDTHSIMGRAFILPVLEVVDDKLVERRDRK